MKTEVLITQGETKIVLRAENDFEKDLIEKIKSPRSKYETNTKALVEYNNHEYSNHRIEIDLIETNC